MVDKSKVEVHSYKGISETVTQFLRAYYQQGYFTGYNLDEALEDLLTLTDMGRRSI